MTYLSNLLSCLCHDHVSFYLLMSLSMPFYIFFHSQCYILPFSSVFFCLSLSPFLSCSFLSLSVSLCHSLLLYYTLCGRPLCLFHLRYSSSVFPFLSHYGPLPLSTLTVPFALSLWSSLSVLLLFSHYSMVLPLSVSPSFWLRSSFYVSPRLCLFLSLATILPLSVSSRLSQQSSFSISPRLSQQSSLSVSPRLSQQSSLSICPRLWQRFSPCLSLSLPVSGCGPPSLSLSVCLSVSVHMWANLGICVLWWAPPLCSHEVACVLPNSI